VKEELPVVTNEEKNLGERHEESTEQQPSPDGGPAELEIDPNASQLAELEKQVEYYKDLFYRKAAEFDNFKKRLENDTASVTRYANEDLIVAILPILDDLERSLKLGKELQEPDPFYKGVELIHQKFLKILNARGVRVLECVGKEFDVSVHDALLQVQRPDAPPHTVVEEVEKGYLLHNKVIRHAKVIVSADSAHDESVPEKDATEKNDSQTKSNPQTKE